MAGVGVAFSVTGVPAIDRRFRALPLKVQKKVLRQAIRPAMNSILLPAARAETPKGKTGRLAKSLKVRASRRTRKAYVSLNLLTGEGFFKGKTFYGGFVHFGHKFGKRPGRGQPDMRTKSSKPNPFLKRTYDKQRNAVVADVRQRIHGLVLAQAVTP